MARPWYRAVLVFWSLWLVAAVANGAVPMADLRISKTAINPTTAGENALFDIVVANTGPDDATEVTMTDVTPPNVTFNSLFQSTGPTFTCTTPTPGTSGTVTCSIPSFPNGSVATFSIFFAVPSSLPAGSSVTNTATVSSSTTDPNPKNNSSTASSTVTTNADLLITKSVLPATPIGSNITYTIQAMNSGGPSDAQNVTITDVLPAGTTFVSLVQTGGPTFTCTTGATVTCTIGALQPLATATFTLQVAPSPSAPNGTVVTNTATISSTTPPLFPTVTTSTVSTTIAGTDLKLTKTAPPTVAAGATFDYTIGFTNNGPLEQDMTFTDTLPSGVTFKSLVEISHPIAFLTCSTPTVGSGGTITCTGKIFIGYPVGLVISVMASPTLATGTVITNTANIASTTPPINPANDTAMATTTVMAGNVPAASPLALLLLAIMLAVGGALILRR